MLHCNIFYTPYGELKLFWRNVFVIFEFRQCPYPCPCPCPCSCPFHAHSACVCQCQCPCPVHGGVYFHVHVHVYSVFMCMSVSVSVSTVQYVLYPCPFPYPCPCPCKYVVLPCISSGQLSRNGPQHWHRHVKDTGKIRIQRRTWTWTLSFQVRLHSSEESNSD